MGFRINRGIFQYKDGGDFRNKFKIAEDGSMVEVDADGNPTTAYMKVGDKATDADKLDGINSTDFIRKSGKTHTIGSGNFFNLKHTTSTGFSEIAIKNNSDHALIMGSIGTGYTNSAWAGSRYIYSTSGELRLKAATNLRLYGGGMSHTTNLGLTIDSSSNTIINKGLFVDRHIDGITGWSGGSAEMFLGWYSDKLIVGNNNNGMHDSVRDQPLNTIGVTNPLYSWKSIALGKNATMPTAEWGATGGSTGFIVIEFPVNSYAMIHAEIAVYEYNGYNASTVLAGGHPWNGGWYNYGSKTLGELGKQIRFGRINETGNYCIVLGESGTTWTYGQVQLKRIQNGNYYNGRVAPNGAYSIYQSQDEAIFSFLTDDTSESIDVNRAALADRALTADNADKAGNLGNYYTADDWFRATGNNNHVKFYGNSRQMLFRTDGVTEAYGGIGGYPFVWTYNGISSGDRKMILHTDGRLWTERYGWLDNAFLGKTSKAADSHLLDGINSGAFLRSNADDNVSANTEWQDHKQIRLGNGADLRMWHDGNNHIFRSYHHGANYYFQLEDNEGTNHNAIQLVGNTSRSYVILYENGNERLRTTSDGVTIGKLSFGATTGTWVTSNQMADSIGWNGNHGVYIGSNTLASNSYIYGDGTFYTNGNIYDLIHSGTIGSQSVDNADKLDGSHRHEIGNRDYTKTTFYVDGEPEIYYPVLITPRGGYSFNRWSISRRYNWTAPWDPIGTGSHKGGLTFDFYWAGDTAWGGNDKSIRIHQFSEQYTTMVGGIALARTGGMIVWLRGGHARYDLQVDTAQTSVSVKLEGWTDGSGTRFEPTDDVNRHRSSIWNNYPVRNGDDLYINNNAVATESWVDGAFLRTGEKAADANLLDGINSSQFLRSDTADTMSGNLKLRYSNSNSNDYRALSFWNSDSCNDYIIKASSTEGVFGRKSFGWHVDSASAFGVYSNGWTKLFGVEGLTGNSFVKGTFTSNNLVTNQANIQSLTSDGTIANDKGSYLHIGGWGVGRTAANAVLVNTAYRADYATNLFNENISRFANDANYLTQEALTSLEEGLRAEINGVEIIANSKLDATAKAADSNLLDGIDSSSFIRENQDRRYKVLRFTGEGGDSGNGVVSYGIYQEGGGWSHPYPDLVIGYHTGVKIGGEKIYGGVRIYSDAPGRSDANKVASFAEGDENVRIANNLYIGSAGGWITDLLNAKLSTTGKAADANKLDGYDWMQAGKNIRGKEIYAENWFRNYNSGEGLFNQATGQHFYSDDDDFWNIAGGTAANGLKFRDNHNGTIRGHVYADSSNQVGFLDAGGTWAIKHVNDSHTEFQDAGEKVFSVGQGGHGSNYGTVCTHGGGRGGWEGYSINERFVWMSSDTTMSGMYNDMDNEWMTQYHRNGAVKLYHNGAKKLETTSSGATVTGTLRADSISIGVNPTSGGDALQVGGNGSAKFTGEFGYDFYIGLFDFVFLETSDVNVPIVMPQNLQIWRDLEVFGMKQFRIPHPVAPDTKDLVHAAVESNRGDVMYRGITGLVDGAAVVNMDTEIGVMNGTFETLTKDVQVFTTNEDSWTLVRGRVEGSNLIIEAQDPSSTDSVSWLVIGERNDDAYMSSDSIGEDGRMILEPAKRNRERNNN